MQSTDHPPDMFALLDGESTRQPTEPPDYINGGFGASSGEQHPLTSPGTGQAIAQVPFSTATEACMIGINVGIPAPVAYMPFGGAKSSIFADVKAPGRSVVNFFTQERIVTERWWGEGRKM